MFSLIITIISIALVTALALATIYYGGSAFRQGGDAAKAAQFINEGQQLSGATAVAESNNLTVDAIADLTAAQPDGTVFLASAPAGWADAAVGRSFRLTGLTDKVCDKVNEKAGYTTVERTALLADSVTDAAVTKTYGCFAPAADAGVMVFKF